MMNPPYTNLSDSLTISSFTVLQDLPLSLTDKSSVSRHRNECQWPHCSGTDTDRITDGAQARVCLPAWTQRVALWEEVWQNELGGLIVGTG